MAENPDVTGDFASFNTLSLGGVAVSPGAPPSPYIYMRSATNPLSDDTPAAASTLALVTAVPDQNTLAVNSNTGVRVLVAGVYNVIVRTQINPSDLAGYRRLDLTVNGTSVAYQVTQQITATLQPALQVTVTLPLNANDVLGMLLYQNSGSIAPANNLTMQVFKV